MNLQDIYNYFLSQGLTPAEAAQATAWQAISNPTGNITQLKVPQKYYTDQEIYDFYAPNYSAALNFPITRSTTIQVRDPKTNKLINTPVLDQGIDPLAAYTAESINNIINSKGNLTFGDISNIASNASAALRTPQYGGGSKPFSDYYIGTQDYYNQLKDLVSEYNTAKREITAQATTHPFAQRGLPNPNLRFGIKNDPTKNTVVYPGADEYFKNKVKAQEQILRKAGATGRDLQVAITQYSDTLSANMQKKLDASGLTPFLYEANKLVNVKKGK